MANRTLYVFFSFLFACASHSYSQKLKIRVYADVNTTAAIFTPLAGDYKVMLDTIVLNMDNIDPVFQLSVDGDSIEVKSFEKPIGKCKRISFTALMADCNFKLKSVQPETKIRYFDEDLAVTVVGGYLRSINNVNIEKYIAGVVESEVGRYNPLEYYKLQSIICRTYALTNIRKHEPDSFNLCDQVHCQAYKSRSEFPLIVKSIADTKGLVIVDGDLNLISATFCSNCGGQTVNSEDVWSLSASYLRSVKDTFCLSRPNARWKKQIPKTDWLNYLVMKHKYPVEDSISYLKAMSFPQTEARSIYFTDNDLKIPLKQIRSDWQLKSTYFSIEQKNDSVLFTGRGYGHGVGLCQEGAMKQASYSISYKDIINFYYANVHLVDLTVLSFFKDE